jgi:hypothetical protein
MRMIRGYDRDGRTCPTTASFGASPTTRSIQYWRRPGRFSGTRTNSSCERRAEARMPGVPCQRGMEIRSSPPGPPVDRGVTTGTHHVSEQNPRVTFARPPSPQSTSGSAHRRTQRQTVWWVAKERKVLGARQKRTYRADGPASGSARTQERGRTSWRCSPSIPSGWLPRP